MTSEQARVFGMLFARLGGSMVEMADAIDVGDRERQRRVAEETIQLYVGILQMVPSTFGVDLSAEATQTIVDGFVRDLTGDVGAQPMASARSDDDEVIAAALRIESLSKMSEQILVELDVNEDLRRDFALLRRAVPASLRSKYPFGDSGLNVDDEDFHALVAMTGLLAQDDVTGNVVTHPDSRARRELGVLSGVTHVFDYFQRRGVIMERSVAEFLAKIRSEEVMR